MFQKLREPLPEKNSFLGSARVGDFIIYLPAIFLLCAGGGILFPSTLEKKSTPQPSPVTAIQKNTADISVKTQKQISLQTENAETLLYKARIFAEKGHYIKSFITQLDGAEYYIKQGQYNQALSKIIAAETMAQTHIFSPYSDEMKSALIRTQDLRSEIYFYTKDNDNAGRSASKALELSLEYYGDKHLETAKHYELVSYFYQQQGYAEKSALCLHNAILIFENSPKMDEGELLIKMNNLGEAYRRLQKYDAAEEIISKTILRIEKKYGIDAPELAIPLNNLGLVAFAVGENTKAEAYLSKAYQISRKYQGDDHDVTGYIASNLQRIIKTL